jgi:threonine/homoserine/homoserine lactone efflux protein
VAERIRLDRREGAIPVAAVATAGTTGTGGMDPLAAIAAIWFAATLTPGPDFLITTRTALLHGRAAGRRLVAGLAVGTCAWGLAGFFGIHPLFVAAPFLYLGLKLFGGAYLIVLGLRLLLGSFKRDDAGGVAAPRALGGGSAFRLGLLANLANPKAAVFTTSVFAATLPQNPPLWLGFAASAAMTAICLGWYSLVTLALTTGGAAAAFARLRHWIDRGAGVSLLAFGLHLTLDTRRP